MTDTDLTPGQLKAQTQLRQRIDELIDGNPNDPVSVTWMAERAFNTLPIIGLTPAMVRSAVGGLMFLVRKRLAQRGYVGPAEPTELLHHIRTEILRATHLGYASNVQAIATRVALLQENLRMEFITTMVGHELRARVDEDFRKLRTLNVLRAITEADRDAPARVPEIDQDLAWLAARAPRDADPPPS